MSPLLELSMPWWQFVLRGALAYAGLMILMRLAGKHAVGEMSSFDIILLIVIGSAMQTAVVGDDKSLLGPFIAVVTMLVLDKTVAFAAARSARFNALVEGKPALLVDGGKMVPGALIRVTVPEAAFARELRLKGITSLADIEAARLEPNGKVSLIRRHKHKPGTG